MNKFILVICLLLVLPLQGKQLWFDKSIVEDKYLFEYRWQDQNNNVYDMSFKLDLFDVNNRFRRFKSLSPERIKAESIRGLKQHISSLDPKKGRVRLIERPNGVEYSLSSTDQNWLTDTSQQLDGLYETLAKQYIKDEYYTEFKYFGYNSNTNYYRPDHARFATESIDVLMPIVDAIKEQLPRVTARGFAQYLLTWLQTIPYDEIESRTDSNGAGFLPPTRLLTQNIGDCDSKVTLMASLMKAVFPRIKVVIVYIPQHALVGFNLSHLDSDEILEADNTKFILSEPVGPGLLPFAQISERSQRYIDSGNYSVEVF